MYLLNRTIFKAQSHEEQSSLPSDYKNLSWQERLRITIYLNSIAFKIIDNPYPKMDKSAFTARSRN